MEKKSAAVTLVLVIALVGLLSVPPAGVGTSHISIHAAPLRSGPSFAARPVVAAHPLAATHPKISSGPARTILVEAFTGVWCEFCPYESQALYNIEHTTTDSIISVGEIHVCYSSTNCGDTFPSRDNTSTLRTAYYRVGGFPTVFFDGQNGVAGAIGYPNVTRLQDIYASAISNASAIPANLSIAQTATLQGANVSVHATINSEVTGTYHAVSYLLEFIGKNYSGGGGNHPVENVVRETVLDQTVDLTAGQATSVQGFDSLGTSWNINKLSVVTFVQDNLTKVVENTNLVHVTTLSTDLQLSHTAILSNGTTQVTVTVQNTSTSLPISGATVSLASNAGGSFTPASGPTGSDGTFVSIFTPPSVTAAENVSISAAVQATNYTDGSASALVTVSPVVAPLVPTQLAAIPSSSLVALNWTPPASGAGGVTYVIYRSSSATGTFARIGTASSAQYVDSSVTLGQSYWYKIRAVGSGGYSPNSTIATASSLTVSTSGLPALVGWWAEIDGVNFSQSTNASLDLYMPIGSFPVSFGPGSYAYVATPITAPVKVNGAPQTVTMVFTPRYATLYGTISPAGATLKIGGSQIPIVNGAYQDTLPQGTYSVVVSATGYTTNSTSVTVTPGNTSTLNIRLVLTSTPGGGSSSSGGSSLPGTELIALVAVIAVAGAAVVLGLTIRARGRGGSPRSPSGPN